MPVVEVKMTTPPPSTVSVGNMYKIEGTAKAFDAIGAPPWIYLRVQKKEWYEPSALEATNFLRGFTLPTDGKVSYNWVPQEEGKYNVTIVATPAPIPLPLIGVPPIMGESDTVNISAEKLPVEVRGLEITGYEVISGG